MADDVFSGSDFESAASATASPKSSATDSQSAETNATAQTAETASTDTAATGQAAAAIPVSETPKGPIPFDAHHTALKNAREKAVAEWREKHGWAESIDPTEYQQLQRWGQAYRTDPIRFFTDLAAELKQAYPHLAPNLTSEAARILAGSRGSQTPSFEPDIPVYDERGQMVAQTFSAQKVQELVKHAVAEALGQEVTPIKERLKQADERAKAHEQRQQMESYVDDTYETAVKHLPLFKEHDAEIAAAMATHPDAHPERALWLGWAEVVLPKLSATERKKVLADINQKPAASTVSPSGGTTAVPKPDAEKDWTELLAEEAARLGV